MFVLHNLTDHTTTGITFRKLQKYACSARSAAGSARENCISVRLKHELSKAEFFIPFPYRAARGLEACNMAVSVAHLLFPAVVCPVNDTGLAQLAPDRN